MPFLNSSIVRWLASLRGRSGFDSSIVEAVSIAKDKLSNYQSTQLSPSKGWSASGRNWRLRHSGFTLIELLVVISIIAILVAAATASWTNAQQKSRDGKRKSDLKSIQQSLELYFQNNGFYPKSGDDIGLNALVCNTSTDTHIVAWGGNFNCNNISYFNPMPKDPINIVPNVYYYQEAGVNTSGFPLKYQLNASLENEKDQDYCRSGDAVCGAKLGCTPPANKNYCVVNP